MHSENRHFRVKYKAKKFLFFAIAIILFGLVVGTIVMLLWNAIIPNILNTRPIKFWEAVGLLALCRLLTGGFNRGRFRKKYRRKKHRWKEKWMNMSEEEKAEFKARWKERCGRR